jgi:gliding motility-associated-like protein
MRNKLSKSTARIKSVLFLFLGLLFSITVKAQNCQIIDTAIVTNVNCYAGADGVIDLLLLNPAGNYTFTWDNTAITDSIGNLSVGVYNITIIDQADPTCTQDTSYTITQPQDPLSTATTLYSDVDCFGDSTGVAYAENAIGGTFPYTYAWDNGQNTQLVVNLWEGTHTVTVTDTNGCTAQSSIDIVNSYPEITDTTNILNQVSCFGACDADVEFSAFGGQAPHTYIWDIGQVYYGSSGPDTAFNLCYGGHNVLVEDAIGCQKIFTFTITQPDELFASAIGNGAPIPGQLPTQPVQCFGFDDGTAYASATQGTSAYTFVWDSIQGVSANYNSGQNIDSLAPGIHTVYVTDANGCTASDTVLITEPTELVVEIDSSATIYAYCSNTFSGELCAIASGGTPNYAYAWNDVILQTTACAYNLQPDQYTITVMDERNCIAQASFDLDSITNSMNPDSVVIIENSVSCFGLYDGALTATNVVGGVIPYNYNWIGPTVYTGTGSSISSLYFGSYALAIEDDNGCEITIGTYLNQPDQLEYDIYNTVDATCLGAENGQFWVHVNGGTGGYYYDVLEANSFAIPAANQVPIINDSLIFNLATGTHSIYITDDNNCEGAVTFGAGTPGFQRDINATLTIPAPIFALNTTTCFNTNNGTAQVINPDTLFTYTWESDNSGNPSGIDISNGAGTYFGAFSPGDYWLVAHYADSASFGIPYYGCDNSVPFTISPGTTQIQDLGSTDNVSCYSGNDGQINLIITGGVGPYDLFWDTTSVYPNGMIGATASIYALQDLTVGTYAVTITDSEGCITIEDYEVTEPTPLISDIIPTHVSCFGLSDGEAIVNIVGGSVPITSYDWSDAQINQTATSLFAGTYTVTVTDVQGCSYTDTIVILQPTAPVALVEVDSLYYGDFDVRCFGESNASAIASGSGITFEWFDNNGVSISNDQTTGAILSVGQYTVTSTDANGCEGSGFIVITEPDSLMISVTESNPSSTYQVSCFGSNDGWAEVTIDGGVENNNVFGYDISWVNSAGNTIVGDTIADGLSAGFSYTVTVNDANDCEDIATTILYTEPIEFIAHVTTINYAGPFHAPKIISFIDSTISVEPYNFDWYWNFSVGDTSPDKELNLVDASDNQTFDNEFDLYNFDIDGDGLGEDGYELDEFLNSYSVLVALENSVTECVDTVRFDIEIQGLLPELPNIFTPNQDGINDEFLFSEYAMELVDVQIFNRWGQLVYTWVGSDKSWKGIGIDGKDLPEGVYFYVFEGKGVDGYHYDKKGSVTLLR